MPRPDDEILQHADFLRRLALALVRDEHLAEDVAQDAMVQALDQPPRAIGSHDRALRLLASAEGLSTTATGPLEPPHSAERPPIDIVLVRAGAVVGRVRTADGSPAVEARVVAFPAGDRIAPDPARTGSDGRFRLGGLAPGAHHVVAMDSDGEAPIAGRRIVVEAGGEHEVTLDAAERTAVVSGRVVGRDGGRPSRRPEWVFCRSMIPPEHRFLGRRARVDEDGRFEFTGLQPGLHHLTLPRSSSAKGAAALEVVAPAQGVRLVVDAVEPSILELEVVDEITRDRVGVGELFIVEDGTGSCSQHPFASGFTRVGIVPGAYELLGDVPGYAPHVERLDLSDSPPARFERQVRVGRGRRVAGRVVRRSGEPAPGVFVLLRRAGHPFHGTGRFVDHEGRFVFEHAPLTGGEVVAYDRASVSVLGSAPIGAAEVRLVIESE